MSVSIRTKVLGVLDHTPGIRLLNFGPRACRTRRMGNSGDDVGQPAYLEFDRVAKRRRHDGSHRGHKSGKGKELRLVERHEVDREGIGSLGVYRPAIVTT